MGRAERQRPGTMPDRAKAPIRIHTPYPAVCLPRARQPAPPFLVRCALSGREVLKVVQVAKEALEASSLDLPLDLALSPTLLLGDTAPAASEQLARWPKRQMSHSLIAITFKLFCHFSIRYQLPAWPQIT